MRRSGLLVGLLLALAACGDGVPDPVPKPADDVPRRFGPPRLYEFTLEGPPEDLPFNDMLFLRVSRRNAWGAWEGGAIGEDGRFTLEGGFNERYHVRSEADPSDAERALFWMFDFQGRLPEETLEVTVPLPPRTTVRVPVPPVQSSYAELSFVLEEEGYVGTVLNDPTTGLFEALWERGEDGISYKRLAKPAPFEFRGFAPGRYALAVRVKDRQWWTGRVTLEPGGTLDVPAHEQPTGGGRVVVEDAHSLLHLHGEFPVAAARRRADLRYRDTWSGVPPGTHELRWPDGRSVTVEVADGEEIVVRPPPPLPPPADDE